MAGLIKAVRAIATQLRRIQCTALPEVRLPSKQQPFAARMNTCRKSRLLMFMICSGRPSFDRGEPRQAGSIRCPQGPILEGAAAPTRVTFH
jgi:hypothetical protein